MDDDKARIVLAAFDTEKLGYVNYNEFLRGIRVSVKDIYKIVG